MSNWLTWTFLMSKYFSGSRPLWLNGVQLTDIKTVYKIKQSQCVRLQCAVFPAVLLRNRQLWHTTYKMFMVSVFLWTAHLFFMSIAYGVYGNDGNYEKLQATKYVGKSTEIFSYFLCSTRQNWISISLKVWLENVRPGSVFIKHLKSNMYVTLNAIGSFQCNLCSHWLIQIFIT